MNKYLLGALALTIALAGLFAYGRYEHSQGWNERDTAAQIEAAQLLAQARTKELAAQTEMEKVRNDAYQQKQVADGAIAAAHNDVAGLRNIIATQARKLKAASAAAGTHDDASVCWIVLDEAISRYSEVAKDADRYVERIRIGQGWAGAVQKQK